jgi:hypothetical protein
MRSAPALFATALVLATAASAATIDTLGDENSTVRPWGQPDTSAYGQTITVVDAFALDNFQVRINDIGTAISFTAHVFAWLGDRTGGAALATVLGATSGSGMMETITIDTSGLILSAGEYVLFLQATSGGAGRWGSVRADAYADGAFVFQNNSGDTSHFGTEGWTANLQGPGYDLAFGVNTAGVPPAVPLPASSLLLLAGIAGLAGTARRSRR